MLHTTGSPRTVETISPCGRDRTIPNYGGFDLAGYRGDMGFAALIVGGGTSEYAVRMATRMSQSLPGDYLHVPPSPTVLA